jgi:hypothetical protein
VGHNRSVRVAGGNTILHLSGIEPRFLGCPARSLVTIITELSRRLRRMQSNQASDRADLCGLTGGA